MVQQQLAFERFRQEFNHDRPHEALGMKVPNDLYDKSPRIYTGWVTSCRIWSGYGGTQSQNRRINEVEGQDDLFE